MKKKCKFSYKGIFEYTAAILKSWHIYALSVYSGKS